MATAVPINVDLAILMIDSPLMFLRLPVAANYAVAFPCGPPQAALDAAPPGQAPLGTSYVPI
jgi:hypothetical protein